MTQILSSAEIIVPHAEVVRLREQGKLSLGISKYAAHNIALNPVLKPRTLPAAGAFQFWNLIAVGILVASVIPMFIMAWWWILVGLGTAIIISRANSSANQSNMLDAAMIDPEFYYRIAELGGWMYQLDDETAAGLRQQ